VVSPHAYHANGTSVRANLSSINLFWPSRDAHAHTGLLTPEPPKSVVSPSPALDDDKYSNIKEENTMPQIVEPTSIDDEPEAQRTVIRLALDGIAIEVGAALRDARLDFPVGLTVPSSGYALATMVTPVDPGEDDWFRATAIVRRIVSSKLGGIRLRSQPLPCTMVNASMNSTELTADVRNEE
jgi:hypothetical protein